VICAIALIPVATTVLISFKGERDTIRKPPVIFPCDTPDKRLRPLRLSLGGGGLSTRAGA
jgi:hypothetical protein